MGLVVTKPVFRVSDKARLKPVSSATETSKNTGISLLASLDMVLSKTQITKALTCADGQAGLCLCCSQTPKDRFSRSETHILLKIKSFVLLVDGGKRIQYN